MPPSSYAGGAAGTISILFTFVAIAFGWINRRFGLSGWRELLLAVVLFVLMFAVGMQFPVYLDKNGWFAVIMVYLLFAAAMPIQTLKQPRDYLTSIMMLVMIACAVIGVFVLGAGGQATMTAPMVADLDALAAKGSYVFPLLFVSVACGALSGFHSLVSTNTSSKQVSSEKDALPVGYGAMVLESFVGVLAIVFAAIMFSDLNTAGTGLLNNGAAATPFQIFSQGVARGMTAFGVDSTLATVFMTMCVSALALTSVDARGAHRPTLLPGVLRQEQRCGRGGRRWSDRRGQVLLQHLGRHRAHAGAGPRPRLWRVQQHLAALWRVQPAARRHDDDHARGLLQVHGPQGIHALTCRWPSCC